ncbi:YggT family protein [Anaerosalibacter sp. Marseille-P3206]|uniref:YggT family protein n=1 Tax=Anaerosalibacter sp. Marseille-P3206 TaxID=1871005 RepID=UPI000986E1AF|nr:YggT family protein [Anaerosalibacter sp. Marseille-P3206]
MTVLFTALNILFNLIELFILVRIILSYIPINMNNFFGKFIYSMTEPILSPCRELLYKLGLDIGLIDFSPLLAVLFLRVARYIIISIIF